MLDSDLDQPQINNRSFLVSRATPPKNLVNNLSTTFLSNYLMSVNALSLQSEKTNRLILYPSPDP